MSKPDEVRRLIGRIGSDPKLIDDLIAKKDQNERKAALVNLGIVGSGEKGPTREEVAREITRLLSSAAGAPTTTGTASGERAVEWVAAIGTAAAGAAAGACTADA